MRAISRLKGSEAYLDHKELFFKPGQLQESNLQISYWHDRLSLALDVTFSEASLLDCELSISCNCQESGMATWVAIE